MQVFMCDDIKICKKYEFFFRSLEPSPRGQRQASSGSGSGRIGLMSRNMNGTSKSIVSILLSIPPASVNHEKLGFLRTLSSHRIYARTIELFIESVKQMHLLLSWHLDCRLILSKDDSGISEKIPLLSFVI